MTVIDTPAPTTTAPERRRLMGKAYDISSATTADEARVLAGLDWDPVHRPLYVDLPNDEGMAFVEKERAVVNGATGEMFGVVGREHKILTNAAFFDFADTVLDQADLTWAEADAFGGALGNGKQPFLVLRLGEGIQVAGQDAVDQHILFSNGHVGNQAFTVTVLPVRLQCSNIVTAALRMGRKGQNLFTYTVQHSGNLDAKVAQAQAALEISSAYMREFADLANRLADIDFGLAEFDDLLTSLVPVADDAGDRAKATAAAQRGAFRLNWLNTTTLDPDLKGTAWGALNVITEVIDHGNLDVRKSKVPAAERRVRSVNFGAGARMRERAYGLLAG
jgi:phage/plasmid-like protein (TIGR03299 family)